MTGGIVGSTLVGDGVLDRGLLFVGLGSGVLRLQAETMENSIAIDASFLFNIVVRSLIS